MVVKFAIIALTELIEQDEAKLTNFLRSFSCKKDSRIQDFLHNQAIENSKRDWGRTYLIVDTKTMDLLAFFTLTDKIFTFDDSVSKTTRRRVTGDKSAVYFSSILIANLAKNDNFSHSLSGGDLLELILSQCKLVKDILGLKVVTVEFEDNPRLVEYYNKNGFIDIQTKVVNGLKTSYTII